MKWLRPTAAPHPWSLEQGTESTLLLFNYDKGDEKFTVSISDGSAVWQKDYVLSSMRTEAINIRDLIKNKVKDDSGKTLPKSAMSGQVAWSNPEAAKGAGRLLESNSELAMARSFSCLHNHSLCSVTVSPSMTTLLYAGNITMTATPEFCVGDATTCFGDLTTGTANYFWSTGNAAVATVGGNGQSTLVTAVGGGVTNIKIMATNLGGFCWDFDLSATTVQVPTADRLVQQISAFVPTSGCAAGKSGYFRKVQKIVTDQNVRDITVAGQALAETVTVAAPNDFAFVGFIIGASPTDPNGMFFDTFSFCSALCPTPDGVSVVNQVIHDNPPGTGVIFDLKQNVISFTCHTITVNGL